MHILQRISAVLVITLCACNQSPDQVIRGTLVMGPDVSSFTPDGQDKEFWLIDKSDALYKQYVKVLPAESSAYTPVVAELKVEELPKMQDGFGAEYDGTYNVVEIISITPIKK